MLKAFDGHTFEPYGILTIFFIELAGKTVLVDVEVLDAPLEYNLLLGNSWFYWMKAILSSIFQVLHFPHQGNIVMIDQPGYCTSNLRANDSTNVLFVGDSQGAYESVSVGMFKDSSLMGTFPFSLLDTSKGKTRVCIISSVTSGSLGFYDPWLVPSPIEVDSYGARMPLHAIDTHSLVIQSTSYNPNLGLPLDVEPYLHHFLSSHAKVVPLSSSSSSESLATSNHGPKRKKKKSKQKKQR